MAQNLNLIGKNKEMLENSVQKFYQKSEITYNWELLFYLCFPRQPIMRSDWEVKLGSVPFCLISRTQTWQSALKLLIAPAVSLLLKINTINHPIFFTGIRRIMAFTIDTRVTGQPDTFEERKHSLKSRNTKMFLTKLSITTLSLMTEISLHCDLSIKESWYQRQAPRFPVWPVAHRKAHLTTASFICTCMRLTV